MKIRCPEVCPCCGEDWIGGHVLPGEPMKPELRVFYKCGASASVLTYMYGNGVTDETDYWYAHILWKSCWCEKCRGEN